MTFVCILLCVCAFFFAFLFWQCIFSQCRFIIYCIQTVLILQYTESDAVLFNNEEKVRLKIYFVGKIHIIKASSLKPGFKKVAALSYWHPSPFDFYLYPLFLFCIFVFFFRRSFSVGVATAAIGGGDVVCSAF